MPPTKSKQAIWEKKNPKKKSTPLTKKQKAKAKRTAKKHGRSTPSLVDNINAQKSTKKKKSKKK
jgi:hypothetical protein